MVFYGNSQKTMEFVLSKYIPIGFSESFFPFFTGRGPRRIIIIGRGSAMLHRLPNILSPLRGSFAPKPKSRSDGGN